MLPHVVSAEPANEYRIHLTFSDGISGVVDFREHVVGRGGMFSVLEAPSMFNAFTIDAESGTLVWPNGVDFCPVTLHALAISQGAVAA